MYTFDPQKLEKHMEKKGYNVATLARSIPCSHTAVAKWLHDSNSMSFGNFCRLTEIFNCSPNSLTTKLKV